MNGQRPPQLTTRYTPEDRDWLIASGPSGGPRGGIAPDRRFRGAGLALGLVREPSAGRPAAPQRRTRSPNQAARYDEPGRPGRHLVRSAGAAGQHEHLDDAPLLRAAHPRGAGRTVAGARSGRIVGGQRRRQDVHLQGARGTVPRGTPFTAEDAAFCIDRAAKKEGTPWQFIISGRRFTEAPDPRTCVIHLKSVWAPFEADLAMFAASIFPKAAYEEQGDAFFEHPIGTGPFQFVSRTPDVEVVLEKNPNYWQPGIPYLDGATFKVLKTPTRASCSCRAASSISRRSSPTTSSRFSAATRPTPSTPRTSPASTSRSINTTRPPFDDKKLRQAMNYAVNKESIIQNVLFGNGEMATSFLPKMPGRDPNRPATLTT